MKKITFILCSLVIIGLFTIFGICKPLSSTNVNVLNTQTKSKYVKSSFINHINDIEKEKEEEEKFEEEVEKKQKNIELREQVSPSIDKKVVVSEKKESTKEEKKTENLSDSYGIAVNLGEDALYGCEYFAQDEVDKLNSIIEKYN